MVFAHCVKILIVVSMFICESVIFGMGDPQALQQRMADIEYEQRFEPFILLNPSGNPNDCRAYTKRLIREHRILERTTASIELREEDSRIKIRLLSGANENVLQTVVNVLNELTKNDERFVGHNFETHWDVLRSEVYWNKLYVKFSGAWEDYDRVMLVNLHKPVTERIDAMQSNVGHYLQASNFRQLAKVVASEFKNNVTDQVESLYSMEKKRKTMKLLRKRLRPTWYQRPWLYYVMAAMSGGAGICLPLRTCGLPLAFCFNGLGGQFKVSPWVGPLGMISLMTLGFLSYKIGNRVKKGCLERDPDCNAILNTLNAWEEIFVKQTDADQVD